MSVEKRRLNLPSLTGRQHWLADPADRRETSFVGETAAFRYRIV
jgi:hypothetical protein